MVTQPLTETRIVATVTNDVEADQKILKRFNQYIGEYLEGIDFGSPGIMEFHIKSTDMQSYLNIVEQMMGISFRLTLTRYQLPSGDVTARQTLYDVHLVELDRPRNFAFSLDGTKSDSVKDEILALYGKASDCLSIRYIGSPRRQASSQYKYRQGFTK